MHAHPIWFVFFIIVMTWFIATGVGLFYHRILTHGACKPNKLLAYLFVTIAAPAGTPIQWVGNHRWHHKVTDTEEDHHSPQIHGFWVAHAGWYLGTSNKLLCFLYSIAGPLRILFDAFWRPRTNQEFVGFAGDIARDPYYEWLSRPLPYAFALIGHVFFVWTFVLYHWGWWAGAILYVIQVSYFVIGDSVNSINHLWGEAPFNSGDNSRNVSSMRFVSAGESFHNNHHAFPGSANCGLLPNQFDLNYVSARFFEKLGLMTDIRTPTKEQLIAKAKTQQVRSMIDRHHLTEPPGSVNLNS